MVLISSVKGCVAEVAKERQAYLDGAAPDVERTAPALHAAVLAFHDAILAGLKDGSISPEMASEEWQKVARPAQELLVDTWCGTIALNVCGKTANHLKAYFSVRRSTAVAA